MADEAPRDPSKKQFVGKSKAAAEIRYQAFVDRYLVNGNNACEAARHAGYAEGTAKHGIKLMRNPRIVELLGHRAARVANKAGLSAEKWAAEIAAISHFDPGELYDAQGCLIPLPQLPEHVRRAIGSIDIETRMVGKGEDAVPVTTTRIKPCDKNSALDKYGKHLGLFEKDHSQSRPDIKVLIQLLG